MRIAYVCADQGVPVFGQKGCSIHVQEVVRALLRRGDEVEIHAVRVGGTPPPGLEGVRTVQLSRHRGEDPAARELASLAVNEELTMSLLSRPAYDLVYERHSLWSTAAMDFARARGIPGILEVNAPLIEEQATHRRLVHRDIAERSTRRALEHAGVVIAVSKGVAASLSGLADLHGRLHVVPNGVDPERFHTPHDRPRDGATFTAGFVGSLKPWHDLPTLVEAFDGLHRRHRDTRLLVVGDGPERARLVADLEARGLQDPTHLTGAVTPADVPRWVADMHVGVAPYPAGDCYFSPLKLFEYMAAGLAVVASSVGQITELIEHEETGLLCEPGDAASLGMALERLHGDRDLCVRLGTNARAAMLRAHTWNATVARILNLAGAGVPEPQRGAGG